MTSPINEKISELIQDQVPDFIRDTYPVFQTFLEKYYEKLEQVDDVQYTIQKAKSFADIDETANAFVDFYVDQFGYNIPNSIFKDQQFLVDSGFVSSQESKRSFVKRITDYHGSKGSEKAIRLLFRLLFNAEISVYYPKVDLFKPSDSQWTGVKTISLYDPLANVIISNYTSGEVEGQQSKASVVLDSLYSLSFIENDTIPVYEMKIEEDTLFGGFVPGETVTLKFGNLITGNLDVIANVKFYNAITSIDILDPGIGHNSGALVFRNDSGDVENFLGEIGDVGGLGQVKTLKIQNPRNKTYEYNTNSVFNLIYADTLSSHSGNFSLKSNIADIVLSSQGNALIHNLSKNDTINLTFTSGITRGTNVYTVNSILNSRKFSVANTLLGGNANTIVGGVTLDAKTANIKINIGAIATYPAEFIDLNSQLSSTKKIQDGDFYQNHSYQITADQSSYLWKDILKKSIHPVGYKLFTKVFLVFANAFNATRVEPGGAYTTALIRLQIVNPIPADAPPPNTNIHQIILESVGRVSRDLYKYRSSGMFYRDFDKWKFYNSSIRIYDIADWTPERVTNYYDKITSPEFALSTNLYQGGPNLILNSRFTSSSDWTLGSGHNISSNNLRITSSSANTIQQYNAEANSKYMVTYEIVSRSAGSVALSSNTATGSNVFVGRSRSTPGNYSEIFWVDKPVANIIISPSSFTGNISNVHVKKLTVMLG